MIEQINTNNQIQGFLEKSSSKQPSSAQPLPANSEDASLQADYASLINKAVQLPQTDTQAVQRAQELLSSGQLESEENFQAAAENIVEFGV